MLVDVGKVQQFIDDNPGASLGDLAAHLGCTAIEAASALKFIKAPDHALKILKAARMPLTLSECQELCPGLNIYEVSELITEMLVAGKLCVIQNPSYVEGSVR